MIQQHEEVVGWAQEQLSGLQKQFDLLFESAPVMMHSIDTGGTLVRVNDRWLQAMGYEREEVLGVTSREVV